MTDLRDHDPDLGDHDGPKPAPLPAGPTTQGLGGASSSWRPFGRSAVVAARPSDPTRVTISLVSIDVSKEFEQEIKQRVAQGPYASAEEFLRASVQRADEYRAQIRAAIDEGTAQARRGELSDGEVFLDRLDADLVRGDRDE